MLKARLHLDVIGSALTILPSLRSHILGCYDLIFAVGKSALEALAMGIAVIVCDYGKIGTMITMKNVHQMRQLNFGLRILSNPLTVETVLQRSSFIQ